MSKPSDHRRRILTLPAVHPCEAISPTTLLHSLIALCGDIAAYRLESFPIHRRSVYEAFREVGILLAFFDDIRNRNAASLPQSVIIGFSELHVALQKLRHLIHDCSRREARLWVLMMSDHVSAEFRAIARSVGTAVDVLPLEAISADVEVKELVRLLAKQAWKASMETDAADASAVRDVWMILSQFQNSDTPRPADLRRVLDHLCITSWSECNEEILFLEQEFFTDGDGQDAFLGSLMGFMAYCRVSLFDVVNRKKMEQKECKTQEANLGCFNSEDLRCPISLDLMVDPVTIITGHTYDRLSIERWFKAGYLTCPVTGEKLTSAELVPNYAAKKIIAQLYSNCNIPVPEPSSHNRKRDVSKTQLPSSSAAAGATKMVATLLVDKLATGTNEDRNKAALEVRILCKSSLFNRVCLVEAGSVPWLLYLIYASDPSTQENAVAALLNLSKHPDGRKAIHESGGLALVIDAIREGLKLEAQQNAAAILFYLSSVAEYRREIGEVPEAIPTLIELLGRGTFRGKKNALVTLFGLLLFSGNHPKVLAAGAIPVLTNLLSEEKGDVVNDSVAVLGKLAERREGATAILMSSAVTHLVEVLGSSVSRSGKEYCVSALLALCNNGGEKAVRILEKMPPLMPSLYSLVTEVLRRLVRRLDRCLIASIVYMIRTVLLYRLSRTMIASFTHNDTRLLINLRIHTLDLSDFSFDS